MRAAAASVCVPIVAIPDDRPRHIKAVITWQQRGLTTKTKSQDSLGNSLHLSPDTSESVE